MMIGIKNQIEERILSEVQSVFLHLYIVYGSGNALMEKVYFYQLRLTLLRFIFE